MGDAIGHLTDSLDFLRMQSFFLKALAFGNIAGKTLVDLLVSSIDQSSTDFDWKRMTIPRR